MYTDSNPLWIVVIAVLVVVIVVMWYNTLEGLSYKTYRADAMRFFLGPISVVTIFILLICAWIASYATLNTGLVGLFVGFILVTAIVGLLQLRLRTC